MAFAGRQFRRRIDQQQVRMVQQLMGSPGTTAQQVADPLYRHLRRLTNRCNGWHPLTGIP